MDKLSWSYDDECGCEVAMHNGYRIRAEHDSDARNPFEEDDGHWPIVVYHGRGEKLTVYDKISSGYSPDAPLSRFSDEQLVHNQKALAKILDVTIASISVDYEDLDDDADPSNYIYDADILRNAFDRELDEGVRDSQRLGVYSALYTLIGIPSYVTTSRGYCQGDWAEVLVVATPEACEQFGVEKPLLGVGPDAHVAAYWDDRLESTTDLYGAWAWGDVYGYIVEKPTPAPAENDDTMACTHCGRDNSGHEDEPCLYEGPENDDNCPMYDDPDNVEWEEIEHGSCWGYYGSDHTKSGLEEAALDAVPDEPAPGSPVRSSDDLLECV